MKNLFFCAIALLGLFFTSCSKDEKQDTDYHEISSNDDLHTILDKITYNVLTNGNALKALENEASDDEIKNALLKDCGMNHNTDQLDVFFRKAVLSYRSEKLQEGYDANNIDEVFVREYVQLNSNYRDPCDAEYVTDIAMCVATGFTPIGPVLAYACAAGAVYKLSECKKAQSESINQ